MLDLLEKCFDALVIAGLVNTQTEYSDRWLGQSAGYFAYLRSAKAKPSIGSLAHLGERLLDASMVMARQKRPTPEQRRHREGLFRLGTMLTASVVDEALRRQCTMRARISV
jgi:hypothetical protein